MPLGPVLPQFLGAEVQAHAAIFPEDAVQSMSAFSGGGSSMAVSARTSALERARQRRSDRARAGAAASVAEEGAASSAKPFPAQLRAHLAPLFGPAPALGMTAAFREVTREFVAGLGPEAADALVAGIDAELASIGEA